METIENVKELQTKKQTFVSMKNVIAFLGVCAALGIICYGGAFDSGFSGQWFYSE